MCIRDRKLRAGRHLLQCDDPHLVRRALAWPVLDGAVGPARVVGENGGRPGRVGRRRRAVLVPAVDEDAAAGQLEGVRAVAEL
eukprot:2753314-Prymnesium_polylepis.1